jgi:protein-L-isoaspartate O-methyltransferase
MRPRSVLLASRRPSPAAKRARMVATIEAHAKQASIALGRHFNATDMLKVVGDVPRHEFVPDRVGGGDAYADRPLPIGYGQTISQPFIVALMTDLALLLRQRFANDWPQLIVNIRWLA